MDFKNNDWVPENATEKSRHLKMLNVRGHWNSDKDDQQTQMQN